MGANTLLETSRSLRLYVPELPVTLAEQFIRDRYRRILDRRDWSGCRAEAEFQLNDAKTDGTVAFTRGTDTVTGTDTDFEASDIGRQFKAGAGSPIYTITAVASQVLTLDRDIGVATATVDTYHIFDAYVTVPTDFLRFVTVYDPEQGWRLHHWVTAGELSMMDSQRTFMGQPYVLADRMYSAAGVPQYEVWPHTITAKTLYYVYIKRPNDLIADTDIPIWPIRSDVLVAGALADVARWPGTRESPNPYFQRPEYWKSYEMEFEDKMIEIERTDEDIYMTMLESCPNYPLSPLSASFAQSHAIY